MAVTKNNVKSAHKRLDEQEAERKALAVEVDKHKTIIQKAVGAGAVIVLVGNALISFLKHFGAKIFLG